MRGKPAVAAMVGRRFDIDSSLGVPSVASLVMSCRFFVPMLFLAALFSAGCGQGYQKKGGRWFYVTWDEGRGKIAMPVPTTDAAHFRVLAYHPDYAIDSRHVFHWASVVAGADPATFEHAGGEWWKDVKSVYYSTRRVADADPGSFTVLDDFDWGTDRQRAYFQGLPMAVHDLASFTPLSSGWARDSVAYYSSRLGAGFGEIVGADYGTFEILNRSYARDRHHVYCGRRRVEGAQPTTFRAINDWLGEDGGQRFVDGKLKR